MATTEIQTALPAPPQRPPPTALPSTRPPIALSSVPPLTTPLMSII